MLISQDIQSLGKNRSNVAILMSGCMLKHPSDLENWNAVYYWEEMMEITPRKIKERKEIPLGRVEAGD